MLDLTALRPNMPFFSWPKLAPAAFHISSSFESVLPVLRSFTPHAFCQASCCEPPKMPAESSFFQPPAAYALSDL